MRYWFYFLVVLAARVSSTVAAPIENGSVPEDVQMLTAIVIDRTDALCGIGLTCICPASDVASGERLLIERDHVDGSLTVSSGKTTHGPGGEPHRQVVSILISPEGLLESKKGYMEIAFGITDQQMFVAWDEVRRILREARILLGNKRKEKLVDTQNS